MVTVDYLFYSEIFHGQMAEADFERLVVYASAYLDELTMGRTASDLPAETAAKVEMAICAVADAYLVNEQGGGIASETNDGISVTYVAAIGNAKTDGRRLYEAAAMFLGSTGLLYRGVR